MSLWLLREKLIIRFFIEFQSARGGDGAIRILTFNHRAYLTRNGVGGERGGDG